jgi:hypothetical protein
MNLTTTLPRARPRTAERRVNLLLRTRYDSALALLKPLLSEPDSMTGANLYRAMSQLQKTYPDLSGNEIEALVAAVMRTLHHRGG